MARKQTIWRLQFFMKVWCEENSPEDENSDIVQVEKCWFSILTDRQLYKLQQV